MSSAEGTPALEESGGRGALRDSQIKLVRRAIESRWPIPREMMAEAVEVAKRLMNDDDARVRSHALRVLTAMEAQNQADDHLADKNARLDEGKPTERLDSIEIVIPGMK